MRKLMWFSLGFLAAALVGLYLLQGQWYFLASGGAAFLLGVCLWLRERFAQFRIGVVVFLGCTLGFLWLCVFETTYLSVPRAADEQKLQLTITATDYSQESEYGGVVDGLTKLDGKWYTIRIYLPEMVEIAPGDMLTARYLLRSTLPGNSGQSQYQSSQGRFLTAKPMRMPQIVSTEKLPLYGYPAFLRQEIKNLVHKAFPEDTAGFARALLIGDKDGLDYETDAAFQVSGISHIVAVSGLHVTILFSLVYFLIGKKRLLAVGIGIPLLFCFAALAGFSPSIMRACIMHSLMIIATIIDKDDDPPTSLAFAVLVMLLINPRVATNVSFQLSVSCMVGILIFAEPIYNWLMADRRLGRVSKKWKKYAAVVSGSVAMTVGATLAVTPLCAYYFGLVSLVGVVTNLLTTWVLSFIFTGIMLACVLAAIWMPLGNILAWIVAWPIRYVLTIARWMATLPMAAVYMDSIYMVIWLVFVYLLLAIYLLAKKKPIILLISCVSVSLCLSLILSWLQPRWDECRITVMDVGQGQCILLQSQGRNYLVDCGGESETFAANTATKLLKSQGISRLDGIILTHYDTDHAGGIPYLLTQVTADMLYLPNCADADGMLEWITDVYDGTELYITEDICISFGDAKLTLIPSKSKLSDNESGLCVLFQTENCDILITGDRSVSGERELMRAVELPQLEILIVGHHGSKNSTGTALLEQTCPQVAVISVGADNSFGHPEEETLEKLQEAGCVIYRTDLDGTIILRR